MLVVGGVHVSNLTVILDYGFTAVLLFMAARSFAKVADDTSNQLRLVFQVRSLKNAKPLFSILQLAISSSV